MNSFSEVFEEVKRFCIESGKVGEVPLKTWIGSLEPVELNGQNAVFKVQSEFQKNIISNNYEEALKEAFHSILGFNVDIIINVVSN
ncbi:MAG: chromosomal replication initiator protein DnaA, partial [Ruminococcus sp.]|nr:chromosomal replication initiator protein DnaA [Ruminococcus sp.]